MSDHGDDDSTNKDSNNLEESRGEKDNKLLGSNPSKRLANIGKSPTARNKFKLNLFGDDKKDE